MTKAEHREAYEAHRERAGKLLETIFALTPSSLNFRTFTAEYHDELAAMSYHYTAAQLLEEMGHG
jgi:hypothetical protein